MPHPVSNPLTCHGREGRDKIASGRRAGEGITATTLNPSVCGNFVGHAPLVLIEGEDAVIDEEPRVRVKDVAGCEGNFHITLKV